MSSREAILNRIRRNSRESVMPPAWKLKREYADLPAQFSAALKSSGGESYLVASLVQAKEKLAALLTEIGAEKVVANRESPLTEIDIPGIGAEITWTFAGQPGGNWRKACEKADAGITGAQGALAETGSIILASGAGKSRLVSALPPVHFALLPVSAILPDIHIWLAGRKGDWPANLVLVSGPSKTGDIEQTLTIGVHGPKRLVVIVYGDQRS